MIDNKTAMKPRDLMVRIIDKEDPNFGQEFPCVMTYYGYNGGPDGYYFKMPDGTTRGLPETKVDVAYFREQELAWVIDNLGANVGDTVQILEKGSYSCGKEWKSTGNHKITAIDSCGHVTFDNGICKMFRPKVKVIESPTCPVICRRNNE